MLRFRRYRVFLIFAVFAIGLIYHFSGSQQWEAKWKPAVGKISNQEKAPQPMPTPELKTPTTEGLKSTPQVLKQTSAQIKASPKNDKMAAPIPTTHTQPTTAKASKRPVATEQSVVTTGTPTTPVKDFGGLKKQPELDKYKFGLGGKGRLEVPEPLPAQTEIHWKSLKEHFPVPTEKLIQLPTGKPVAIPLIQHSFEEETLAAKSDRENKLAKVKAAFQFSWNGYAEKAWQHDELRPVTGSYRDTFNGWGATMVDALDTLWIMGLTEEFEDAVKAVGGIDFTTSSRRDIPVFETVIRYLGGLISAYDVSEGRYDILLRKAVELANVLMGAFDTPNRMPQTYYNWRPTFASNPHRASYNVVLAELGSLSMEFTRLAQLTKEPKYYDAVARITNELSIWQNNTKIPGLWPKLVDASGCKKPEIGGSSRDIKSTENITPVDARPEIKSAEDVSPFVATPLDKRETLDKVQMLDNRQMLDYRQIDPEGLNTTISPPKSQPQVLSQPQVSPQPQNPIVECEEQGLASRPGASTEAFTLGGMADSTYEYLPKQFLLLGGLVPKYKSMYEKAADAATNYLLYRPMIPDSENSILAMASGLAQNDPSKLQLSYEQGHLTCFLGGMYGIGAKIFKREQDLEIAKKLTDGCVWAYSATKSGLMPENFLHIPCDNMENCPWNQTTWEHLLDPHPEQRQSSYDWAVKHEQDLLRLEKEKLEKALSEKAALEKERFDTERLEAEIEKDNTAEKLLSTPTHHTLKKRQLGHVDNILPSNLPQTSASTSVAGKPITPVDQLNPSTKIPPLLSHKDYVEDRVKGERMSLGIPQILSPKYILRPEAIESVFIMYRITGDPMWREKGWKMFQAVDRATRAEYGHSAIADVTNPTPTHLDEMESFWLAETLKYFYLLFAEESTISLDDWVLNTEAHPFRRPK